MNSLLDTPDFHPISSSFSSFGIRDDHDIVFGIQPGKLDLKSIAKIEKNSPEAHDADCGRIMTD
jgi:hypothetical protein